MAKKLKIALIDTSALVHRAYHALPPMMTKSGQPTGAVYGFTTMLLKMFSTLKPTHAAAAMDVRGKTFRHEAFADYKAHRKKPDEELVAQFEVIDRVLEAFNIPMIRKAGFEADDVIGTLARQIGARASKVIVTGDKDALQLVDDNTKVFTLKRGISDTVLYDAKQVEEEFGFKPERLVDYKGLRGDPSDNIPGLEGIGDKTAKELVGKYGSIEEIYQHLEELPARVQKRLAGKMEEAVFSRKLALIDCEVPVDFKLADAETSDFDPGAVRELFKELEFNSLLERMPASSRGGQADLFNRRAKEEQGRELPANYAIAASEEEQRILREKLAKAGRFAFDTENERLGARRWPIVGMSFAVREGKIIKAWYVPTGRKKVKAWQGLLEDDNVKKVGHNIKYDTEVLRQSGIELKGIFFDTMIAGYLLMAGGRQFSLKKMALAELARGMTPIEDLIGKGKQQKSMAEVPLPELAYYACEDAEVTWQLYEALEGKIKKDGLTRVMEELELPLIDVLVHIEMAGIKIDTKLLNRLSRQLAGEISRLEKQIVKEAGVSFNVNSTVQLREILYKKMNLPTTGIKKTQSGFSTAAPELVKLRGAHSIIPLIEDYRELTKLQSTYVEPLPELTEEDGRVHGSFNQTVAATGRLSSTDPNLQNIPTRTELGQEVRAAFVAEKGWQLVKADYSQLELRVVAHLSQDEKMLETFRSGQDIHRATAAWVQGILPAEVTPQQRREAKSLNFGVLYGMGPMKFAGESGRSVEEARSFIERYWEQYKGVAKLLEKTVEAAEELGFVETMFGRRRYIPEIKSRNQQVRAAAERAAFNFPIQGTAADILKKAMVELHAVMKIKFPEAKMVLTVHDELVCEVKRGEAEALAKEMKKTMEEAVMLDVPLIVDAAAGKNWRDLKELALA